MDERMDDFVECYETFSLDSDDGDEEGPEADPLSLGDPLEPPWDHYTSRLAISTSPTIDQMRFGAMRYMDAFNYRIPLEDWTSLRGAARVAPTISTRSVISTRTFSTAATFMSHNSAGDVIRTKRPLQTVDNLHTSRARDSGLLPDQNDELDWSGFGMHVQFPDEAEVPLKKEREIARTHRAVIDAVRCRRILLARKSMLCHRRFTPQEALEEVKHLNKLKHSHVIRLVGSYFQKKTLSILMYPVANYDLATYLRSSPEIGNRALSCRFGCLSSALAHVHGVGIKHMDIKPKNILVSHSTSVSDIRLYLTDFGISRTITDPSCTETDGPTGRTWDYCSPEVAAGDNRGRSSDIFSLGCVFSEMVTASLGLSLDDFEEARSDDGISYHRNLAHVIDWLQMALEAAISSYHEPEYKNTIQTIIRMLDENKDIRPTANGLLEVFPENGCCQEEPPRFREYA
jgi:tRNA A-37 threonylcarbamoyl transferase component Bud32